MENTNETIQEMLAFLRDQARQKKISTYEIADKKGFKQSSVHRMMSGKFTPRLDNFIAICDVIGFKIEMKEKSEEK
jgi:DNA-binding phage protein